MIETFEKWTAPLGEAEQVMANFVSQWFLSRPKGAKYAIRNEDISAALSQHGLSDNGKPGVHAARIRKIINHIRIHGRVPGLVATGTGYFVASTALESEKYLNSLKQRVDAITRIYEAMRSQHDQLFPEIVAPRKVSASEGLF
jgi:hypothetical protein